MAEGFTPCLDILPEPQRRLWPELAEVPAAFTLYGGTAVALRLGHRQSVDFDFFAFEPIEPDRLLDELALLNGATVLEVRPNTLTVSVDRDGPVKLSFFGVPKLGRMRAPEPAGPIQLADVLDLGGTKARVVQVRAEAKDYIDIDALLAAGLALETMLAAGAAIHGPTFQPLATLKALTYFEESGVADLPSAVRARLIQAVKATDPTAIPVLAPLRAPGDGA